MAIAVQYKGDMIQVQREAKDPVTERRTVSVVGRFHPERQKTIDTLMSKLSVGEQGEIARLLQAREEIAHLEEKVTAHNIARAAARAIAYFDSVTDEQERAVLAASFDGAARALRRAITVKPESAKG